MNNQSNWRGLIVNTIKDIWDSGHQRWNPILHIIHDYWLPYWIPFKVEQTMADVDRQIEEIVQPAKIDAPIYTETTEGSTLLGGEMRLSAPWTIENNQDSE